jgi:putative NADH-flavin reductase
MKIAVVGSNGRSGQAFVREALEQGHTVRAGVLGSTQGLPEHPNLTVVPCNATDSKEVTALIAGQDAVVSLIGHVKGSAADVQTAAMQVITAAMQAAGIRRIVSLTGTGVRFAGDRIPLMDRILNLAVTLIDPARVKDGRNHLEVLRQSNLDWTVIRVLKLQNVDAKPYILREHGPTKLYVSRDDVAQAIVQVLDDKSFIQKAPIICSP